LLSTHPLPPEQQEPQALVVTVGLVHQGQSLSRPEVLLAHLLVRLEEPPEESPLVMLLHFVVPTV
jgi:hypothetical protein